MSMPFYVAPDQLMKDRADFARKGIARGRSVITARYAGGIVFVAANASHSLHKVSEIYDRIGFAAVGRYNEFESLRVVGIRYADLRGYSYDRSDVSARGLANSYAQLLGATFSSGAEKPFEVDLAVAEVGETPGEDKIFRIGFDGTVAEGDSLLVLGGSAEALTDKLAAGHDPAAPLPVVLRAAVAALGELGAAAARGAQDVPGAPGVRGVNGVEVALLDRSRPQPRKFVRLDEPALARLLHEES